MKFNRKSRFEMTEWIAALAKSDRSDHDINASWIGPNGAEIHYVDSASAEDTITVDPRDKVATFGDVGIFNNVAGSPTGMGGMVIVRHLVGGWVTVVLWPAAWATFRAAVVRETAIRKQRAMAAREHRFHSDPMKEALRKAMLR